MPDMRMVLALCLAAAPALAQETPPPATGAEEEGGFSLIEEGARLIFRGLMTEMEPALNEMDKAMDEIGPALDALGQEIGPRLRELVALIDDFGNYAAPEILPNGDILIRRTAPLPPATPEPTPGPDGSIDL